MTLIFDAGAASGRVTRQAWPNRWVVGRGQSVAVRARAFGYGSTATP